MTSLRIAQQPRADRVLSESPFALLCGMLLDQQFPMERAFAGPAVLLERFGSLDPGEIAAADPDSLAELFSRTPAIHRFPASMAGRVQQLAAIVAEEYGGAADRLWTEAGDGTELVRRLEALPGFGRQKAQIFTALLAKQLGVRPAGWERAAGAYAEAGAHRSVADVVDQSSLDLVRAFKKQQKQAASAS